MCMRLCMCAFGQLYKRLAVAEKDPYDDQVSAEEWNSLFNDSNDDDDAFHGF